LFHTIKFFKKMKSTKTMIAIVALAVSFGSCTKLDLTGKGGKDVKATITSEETLTVKAGETITLALPTALAHDGYAVINQSKIASNSAIDAITLATYTYTAPAELPAGITTDEVMVSNDHHVYTSIGHVELPNVAEPIGYPQHYTVNVHIQFVDGAGKAVK
jgi:hypothetical protein